MAAAVKPLSVKLTNYNRDVFVSVCVKKAFDVKRTELQKEETQLAETCYKFLYNDKDRDLLYSLPTGWLPTRNSIRARYYTSSSSRGTDVSLAFKNEKGESYSKLFGKQDDYNYTQISDVHIDTPLGQLLFNFAKKKETLETEVITFKRRIIDIIHSVNTTKQLIEVWPESVEILEMCNWYLSVSNVTPKYLPVITGIRDINKILDIPSEEKVTNESV